MINKELERYVKDQLLLGKTPEEIKQSLITEGGWSTDDIESAFTKKKTKFNKVYLACILIALLLLAIGFFVYFQKDNIFSRFIFKSNETYNYVSQKSGNIALADSKFIEQEAFIYKNFLSYATFFNLYGCVVTKVEAVTSEQGEEIRAKDQVGETMQDFGISCLSKDLDLVVENQKTLKEALDGLEKDLVNIIDEDKADAERLIAIWKGMFLTKNPEIVSKFEGEIEAIKTTSAKTTNFLELYTAIDDRFSKWIKEFKKSYASIAEERLQIINRHTMIKAGDSSSASSTLEILIKERDPLIKMHLANIRVSAEISHDKYKNYDAVCGSNGKQQDSMIKDLISAIEEVSGKKPDCVAKGNPANIWGISSILYAHSGNSRYYWCVDSSGKWIQTNGPIGYEGSCDRTAYYVPPLPSFTPNP